MIRRLILALSLLSLSLTTPARAASPCTLTASALTQSALALAPGTTLCLRAGRYQPGLLALKASGTLAAPITLMAYPGETVTWLGTGGNSAASLFVVQGNYWTVSGIQLDAGGYGVPGIVVNAATVGFTLAGSELYHSRYNLIDVRGQSVTLRGNRIHDADSGVAGDDAQCVNVLPTAANVTVINNTIHDCSGDGVQLYYPNGTNAPAASVWPTGDVISGNVFFRGTIQYSENAIDTKIIDGLLIENNDISGYGFEPVQLIAGGNPSVIIHKFSRNVRMTGNTLHDSAKGVEVFGLSGLDAGAQPVSVTVSGNTFIRIGPGYVINQVGGIAVTVQPNVNLPSGYPTLTATPRPTPTQTATATRAASATSTPTASATAVPTLTGCWNLNHAVPVEIPCP